MLEFTWQSFAFAVVNFLVLIALLYKFLHKPLLGVLQERRKRLQEADRKAKEETEKAQQAWKEYQDKLAQIDGERERILSEARAGAEAGRDKLLDQARQEAEREVARRKSAWERERREALKSVQQDVATVCLEIARGILLKLAGEDVDTRLNAQLAAELDALASGGERRVTAQPSSARAAVRVVSARELTEQQRSEIQQRVQALAGDLAEVEYGTDGKLIAGTRVEFGDLAVDSTLSDVLSRVAERVEELVSESAEAPESAEAEGRKAEAEEAGEGEEC